MSRSADSPLAFCRRLRVRRSAAQAQTKVRVGQPQAGTFQFVPLQVGIETGIFKKHGIEVEISSFGGGPRVQQAIAAGSIDIGLGSGPELALAAKGAPEIGVAAMADAPYSVLLAVLKDSPIKTAADLKGKTISVSSKGSLTYWLAQELSRQHGWGPRRLHDRAARHHRGADRSAQDPPDRRHDRRGQCRLPPGGGRQRPRAGAVRRPHQDVPHLRDLRAARALRQRARDAVRAFLAGWFETIAYMHSHRDRDHRRSCAAPPMSRRRSRRATTTS